MQTRYQSLLFFAALLFVQANVSACNSGDLHWDQEGNGNPWTDYSNPVSSQESLGLDDASEEFGFFNISDKSLSYFKSGEKESPFVEELVDLPLSGSTVTQKSMRFWDFKGERFLTEGVWSSDEYCVDSTVICAKVSATEKARNKAADYVATLVQDYLLKQVKTGSAYFANYLLPTEFQKPDFYIKQVTSAYQNGWQDLNRLNAPPIIEQPFGYWTGSKFLVFGVINTNESFGGGLFNPATLKWEKLNTTGMPPLQVGYAFAWNGERLFVFSGNVAASFDPATNAPWEAIPTSGPEGENAPDFETGATVATAVLAAANSKELYIYGEMTLVDGSHKTLGAVFDLATKKWRLIPTAAPAPQGSLVNAEAFVTAEGDVFVVWSKLDNSQRAMLVGNQWTDLKYTPLKERKKDAPEEPAVVQAVLHKQSLYAFDMGAAQGVTAQYFLSADATVQKLDLKSKTWTNENFGGFRSIPNSKLQVVDGTIFSWLDPEIKTYHYLSAYSDDVLFEPAGALSYLEAVDPENKPEARTLYFVKSKTTPKTRKNQISLLGGNTIFIWGGCTAASNGNACEYVNTGAYAKVSVPKQ